jgi:hypothetical protein
MGRIQQSGQRFEHRRQVLCAIWFHTDANTDSNFYNHS